MIPVLVLSFYMDTSTWRFVAASVFIAACVTDYLDGYVARTFKQTTRFGQFLDPVADKLLIAATLLLLAGFRRIDQLTFIPAIIILCREILVSGLREHLSDLHVTIKVSNLAKWKTACQMGSICLLLVGEAMNTHTPIHLVGQGLLWCAALLTLATGYQYARASVRYF
jgi:cardiolipin synthase